MKSSFRALRLAILMLIMSTSVGCFSLSTSSSLSNSTLSSEQPQLELIAPPQYQVPEGHYSIPYWIENQHLAGDHSYSVSAVIHSGEDLVANDGTSFYVDLGHSYDVILTVVFDHNITLTTTTTITAAQKMETVSIDNRWKTQGTIYTISIEAGLLLPEPQPASFENMTFLGWYKDAELSVLWNFETDIVEGPITLYSRYEQSNLEFVETDLLSAPEMTFVGDKIGQQYALRASLNSIFNFSSISSSVPLRHGALVSREEDFDWYDTQTFKSTSPAAIYQSVNSQPLAATSVPLDFNQTYYYRMYAQYGTTIYLSAIQELKTPILVPTGEKIGQTGYVSGGKYYTAYSKLIELKGTAAISIGGILSNQTKIITRSGIYPIIVSHEGSLYAHMIEVILEPKSPTFTYFSYYWTESTTPSFIPSMQLTSFALAADPNTFKITSYGQLFANHAILEHDIPGVEIRTNTNGPYSYGSLKGYQPTNTTTFYFRSFVVVNDEYYYDSTIYACSNNCMNGEVPEPLHLYSIYYQDDFVMSDLNVDTWVYTRSNDNSLIVATRSITSIFFYEEEPVIVKGITDGTTYYHPVTPVIDLLGAQVELIINDESPIDWASDLTISEPGNYRFRITWNSRVYEVSFTITSSPGV